MPIVAVQGIGLLGKVGHKNILQSVVVPIPELHSHASFGQAILVVASSGVEADLGKAILLVLVEKVHRAVVGHINVGVAVEVVIREGHAQAAPLVNDSHLRRHIAELAVFVAVEHIAYWLVELRLAIGANAALGTDDIVLRVKLHVVGRVEIQIAVEIVV